MQTTSKEARINLAIEAIRISQNLSIRKAAKLYNIPYTTLTSRMNGILPLTERRSANHKMTELEEKSLLQYILDMDERGFSPRISDVEDIANYILETQGAKKTYRTYVIRGCYVFRILLVPTVGKLWAYRFVKRYTESKIHFNCVYDFQRAFCEDSELIERWFRLVSNIRAKYSILDCDFYNFDETGFIMGQISPYIVVTKADRCGKSKAIQSGNREWAIAIICVDGEGHNIPPFLITDNETGLEWIKHFNKYIESRKNFIKAHITYITKTEFFQVFKAAYIEAISISNMKSRIAQHQGSSSTPIFKTIATLAKGTKLLAYTNTLLVAEVHNLRKANEALGKRRRARKALIRKGGVLSVEDKHDILEQENIEDQIQYDEFTNDDSSARRQATIRRCSKCGSASHNTQTYQLDPALVDL
ncbi:hypothetical protein SS1G_07461 [Sclerotinia sclerotiorum 1980 UF-70]|uniref:HTH CENPB-type domain-containing protein n=1 Tax=Sclerotinia sclerotiorum (strain ATCC 18683 / 1980 / Ss-1) TaxID=665079 RepID=A7EQ61_SCLS1|nr:hypothetical protein SS1G_07461 [Sclerotinia sclerotiorum 1980 UF-70]EDO04977.1 hypothetical protein SS1G_07461 [Sclerotinia sclerotiorum 1980 UF-70]